MVDPVLASSYWKMNIGSCGWGTRWSSQFLLASQISGMFTVGRPRARSFASSPIGTRGKRGRASKLPSKRIHMSADSSLALDQQCQCHFHPVNAAFAQNFIHSDAVPRPPRSDWQLEGWTTCVPWTGNCQRVHECYYPGIVPADARAFDDDGRRRRTAVDLLTWSQYLFAPFFFCSSSGIDHAETGRGKSLISREKPPLEFW